MELGIFAKTFAGSEPGVVMKAAAAAGFSAVQYNMACSGLAAMPDAIAPEVIAAIAEASRSTGVRIAALSGTYNMIHPNHVERKAGHRRLGVIAGAAEALGIPLVTLCTGTCDAQDQWRAHPDNDTTAAWASLVESMAIALGIAERHDVDLGIEPELANVVNSAAKARRLIGEMASPRLRIVIDPANLFETTTMPEQRRIVSEAIDLLKDRIVMGHAKDRTASGEFCAAGQGVLDFPHYLQCLARAGFDGPLVTHGLSSAEAPDVAEFLKSALEADRT